MLDEMAVNKLFAWAMMIRVDMDNLGMDTINNYAGKYEKAQFYAILFQASEFCRALVSATPFETVVYGIG